MRITGGRFRGRALKTARDGAKGYRPATAKVREALFSMLMARGLDWDGACALDVFAGSGALGFEALSRGAAMALFMEKDRAAARIIEDNARALGVERQCKVFTGDAAALLARGPYGVGLKAPAGILPAQVCFVDPPYGRDLLEPAVMALLDHGWLAPHALLAAEIEARLDLDPATLDPRLEPSADKTYGQTRIILWQHAISPSIQAPSTL